MCALPFDVLALGKTSTIGNRGTRRTACKQFMTIANLQTEWAALLFRSLADVGVRDVVISPGSRSTPFVVAAVREPRLTRHEVIDERAASFFALGQARITRVPSVLLCTSGTAAAHYLPAII